MTTQHNPSNFDPQQYEIVDYIDNKRPTFNAMTLTGLSAEASKAAITSYEQEVKAWEETIKQHFGETGFKRIHTCEHCNHSGHVRYIAVVKYLPTNENLSFGHICARRLDIKDKATFRLKYILDKATKEHIEHEKITLRTKFEVDHQEFVIALENASKMKISNTFLLDLVYKFYQTLEVPSDRQVECFISSLQKEIEFQKKYREEQERLSPCLEGRITITGTILSVKERSDQFGISWKMLVMDDRNFKVWGSLPSSLTVEDKGKRISFLATVTKSDKDNTFGFFKRPSKAIYL